MAVDVGEPAGVRRLLLVQAVHWVAGSGLYQPRRHRKDGAARFGPSTLLIAQELAKFLQCRPGSSSWCGAPA